MLLYFDPAQHDEGKAAENQLRTTNKVNTQYFVSSIILNCSSFFRLTRSFWLSSLLYWSLVSCSSAVGQKEATFARSCPKAQASSLLCQIRSFVRQGQTKDSEEPIFHNKSLNFAETSPFFCDRVLRALQFHRSHLKIGKVSCKCFICLRAFPSVEYASYGIHTQRFWGPFLLQSSWSIGMMIQVATRQAVLSKASLPLLVDGFGVTLAGWMGLIIKIYQRVSNHRWNLLTLLGGSSDQKLGPSNFCWRSACSIGNYLKGDKLVTTAD